MKGMEEEELDRLNHYRVQLVEKVDNLMFVLKQKRKTVRDITMAVYEFMVKENIQERLQRTEEDFRKQVSWHWRRNIHRSTGSL